MKLLFILAFFPILALAFAYEPPPIPNNCTIQVNSKGIIGNIPLSAFKFPTPATKPCPVCPSNVQRPVCPACEPCKVCNCTSSASASLFIPLKECRAKLVLQEESQDLIIKILLALTSAFALAFLFSTAWALRLQWKRYHFVKPEIPQTADPSVDTGVVNLANPIDPAHDHYLDTPECIEMENLEEYTYTYTYVTLKNEIGYENVFLLECSSAE